MLQEQWTQCEGLWRKSTFFLQLKSENRNTRKGTRVWMTRGEAIAKHGEEIGNALCDEKLRDENTRLEQTKPHWDLPHREARLTVIDCRNTAAGPSLIPHVGF